VKKLLLILLILISTSSVLARCGINYIKAYELPGGRSISELGEVKVGTYNVLNLEFSPGKYINHPKTGERVYSPNKLTKDPTQIAGIAKVIKGQDLDIVVLQEVEGRIAVEMFNRKHLGDKYEVFLREGNDSRGIEIAFLVKKDLPFKIKVSTNKELQWQNNITNKVEKIFSRDLPGLNIWSKSTSGADPPDLVILGNHLKSQRDRNGDPKSILFRTRQVQEIKKVIQNYESDYPGVPVLLAGDFNADIHKGIEFKPLFENNLMTDSFELSSQKLTQAQRITHTFHPRKGPASNSQLDAVLTNKSGKNLIVDAKVYRYKNKNGNDIAIPKTYAEREKNPSDHFPIIVRLDLRHIFRN
jgi:endonuclease/exonuclease/phosphatase family metal-dependent hydrolase